MDLHASIADRYKVLLEANNAALTKSTSEELFNAMCVALKEVLPFDRAGLTLYDPDHDCLKIVALYGPFENSFFRVGDLLGRKTSQNGWTFEHRMKTIRRDLAKELEFPSDKRTLEEGFRSLCSVPLIVRGDSIGVVAVVAARQNQFSLSHAQVVQEMSNQIALAIHSLILRCPSHVNTRLICPRCIGATGGKTTASKHRGDLSNWGKKGGRGRKKLDLN
jgi:formate hydrogenlyase transcriptional activator